MKSILPAWFGALCVATSAAIGCGGESESDNATGGTSGSGASAGVGGNGAATGGQGGAVTGGSAGTSGSGASAGSAGASGAGAAGAGNVSGSDPGTVPCGSTSCAVPENYCCASAKTGEANCVPSITSSCAGLRQMCNEAADCDPGNVCCSVPAQASFYVYTTSCAPSCDTYFPQVCKTDDECVNGQPCESQTCNGFVVQTCGPIPAQLSCK